MDQPGDIHRDILEEEFEHFADLLGKLLRLELEDRLTAKEAQKHESFKRTFKGKEISALGKLNTKL